MNKIDASDPEAQSANLVADNIARLKALFPELITEGADGAAINVDVLKKLVGDATVTDAEEKYGLNWHGKRRARQLALTPSTGTLRPCPEDSVDWDTTQNLMIEGDNLEVLKLLQKSYAGKVKLIYIDPPYNTGKDFVYPDNFQDSIRNYLELTGQVEGGAKVSSNTEASGRFHTDWLNMMYPRLKLARELLQPDGIILVSIDDREQANLHSLMNDVFGEEHFEATFTWQTKQAARGVPPTNLLIQNHEYIACFSRRERIRFRGVERLEDDFGNADNDPRGLWRSESMRATGKQNNFFEIVEPGTGRRFYGNWAFSEETISRMIKDKLILFPEKDDGVPRQKKFMDSYTNETKAIVTNLGWHSTERATSELMQLFDGEKVFDFPKPLSLLEFLGGQALLDHDIVLDFFAGSGTTGQAVLGLNAKDDGNRRFVLVQMPELIDPCNDDQKIAADFCKRMDKPLNITEVTKERLRRAGTKVKADNPDWHGDTGFRVYKLDQSNIRAWQPSGDLERDLIDSVEHIVPGRSEQDVLTELLLKLGLDLCVPIEQRQVTGKTVHAIGGGVLMACLDTRITVQDAEPLALGIAEWHAALAPAGDTTCVFRDSAFENDEAKTNLAAILEQHGIHHVRSL